MLTITPALMFATATSYGAATDRWGIGPGDGHDIEPVQRHVAPGRVHGLRVDVERQHRARAQPGGRAGQHARPRAEVEHAVARAQQPLQRRQRHPRRGVVARPEGQPRLQVDHHLARARTSAQGRGRSSRRPTRTGRRCRWKAVSHSERRSASNRTRATSAPRPASSSSRRSARPRVAQLRRRDVRPHAGLRRAGRGVGRGVSRRQVRRLPERPLDDDTGRRQPLEQRRHRLHVVGGRLQRNPPPRLLPAGEENGRRRRRRAQALKASLIREKKPRPLPRVASSSTRPTARRAGAARRSASSAPAHRRRPAGRPASGPRRCGTPRLRTRKMEPAWVPAGISRSSDGSSRVGISTTVPSAACATVIGSVTRRSSPSRSKTSCGLTRNST